MTRSDEDNIQIGQESRAIEAILQRWWKSGDDALADKAMVMFEQLRSTQPVSVSYQVEMKVRVLVPGEQGNAVTAGRVAREHITNSVPGAVVDEVSSVQVVE